MTLTGSTPDGTKPGASHHPSGPDVYLVQHLRELLAHDPRTSELGIQVDVVDRRVVLSGTAFTPAHRDALAQVAAEVACDCEILNLVEVPSLIEDPDPEEIP